MDTRSEIEKAGKAGYVTGAWSVGQETDRGRQNWNFCRAVLLGMEFGSDSEALAGELRFLTDIWLTRRVQ